MIVSYYCTICVFVKAIGNYFKSFIASLKIVGGPGIVLAKHAGHEGGVPGEDIHAEEADHAEDAEESWHKDFLFRIGAGYDFHYDKVSITPTLDVDYIGGDIAVVVGVGLGIGF